MRYIFSSQAHRGGGCNTSTDHQAPHHQEVDEESNGCTGGANSAPHCGSGSNTGPYCGSGSSIAPNRAPGSSIAPNRAPGSNRGLQASDCCTCSCTHAGTGKG